MSTNPASSICVQCGGPDVKYKCSTCRSPTDCLACFKSHAASHSGGENLDAVDVRAAEAASSAEQQQSVNPSPVTSSTPTTFEDPLQTFSDSAEVRNILESNPGFREKLRTIHAVVRDADSAAAREYAPRTRGRGRGRGRGGGKPWQRPDDLQRGMRALKAARLNEGAEGGPTRRFIELVSEKSASLQTAARERDAAEQE